MDRVQTEESISIETKQDLTRALEKFKERWIAETNDETDKEPEPEKPLQFMDEYDISPEELEQMQINYTSIQNNLDHYRDFFKNYTGEVPDRKRSGNRMH